MPPFTPLNLFAAWLSPTAVVFWLLLAIVFWWLFANRVEIDHFWTKIGFSIPIFALMPQLHMFGAVAPVAAPVLALFVAIIWYRDVGAILAAPFSAIFNPSQTIEETPLFSRAESLVNRGRYDDARSELLQQLRRFPKDYRLHRALAELHLKQLHDEDEARTIMEDYIEKVAKEPGKRAVALHQLADWSLDYLKDLASARVYLERIVAENANPEIVERAGQRLGRLPAEDRAISNDDRAPLALEQQATYYDGALPQSAPQPTEPDPAPSQSEALLDHLEAHPDDAVAREELVRAWAFKENQPDPAMDVIDQFLEAGFLTAPLVAKWLHLKADIQVQTLRDLDAARATLQKIVDTYPESAWSATAQSRIAMLRSELSGIESRAKTIRLGAYDTDIGLQSSERDAPPSSENPNAPRA